jgi:hypothetical protein
MSGGERLSLRLIALIIDRIRGINQRIARLAARIRDGRYAPRRYSAPRRPPATRRPRQPSKLPHNAGWLLHLVPDAVAYRSQVEYLLRDAEVAALLAAAPASLGRPLRSLCWMLGLPPPPILAPPAQPRPPREKKPATPKDVPPPRPQLPVPSWWVEPPRRTRWSFGRLRGPPRPA